MSAPSMFYFDTSALVKHYISELGTAWVQLTVANQEVVIAEIGIVEMAAALSKRKRAGDLDQETYADFLEAFLQDAETKYRALALDRDTLNLAVDLTRRHPLRAYDAVQLATALRLAEALAEEGLALTFVSADATLCAAAGQERLDIVNPNLLPETPQGGTR